MAGTADGKTAGRRPKEIGAAWALMLAAGAANVAVWVLGSFVVEPTGLDDLTATSGVGGAARQLALSGGVLIVVLAGWLAVGVKMRAGRGWARTVLGVTGAASLLFAATDLGMDGLWPDTWSVLATIPDLLTAAAAVPLYLPAARAHFPGRSCRA
ncbi:hypothetical protein [Streptomyces sp. NPDC057686]|uniref:hypothetical protein n=1 Tax=Streptomyces sp. NPDC057686 TaxID=3346212 RepID=UPI0036890BA6